MRPRSPPCFVGGSPDAHVLIGSDGGDRLLDALGSHLTHQTGHTVPGPSLAPIAAQKGASEERAKQLADGLERLVGRVLRLPGA